MNRLIVIQCDVDEGEVGFMIGNEEYIRLDLENSHYYSLDYQVHLANMSEEEGDKFMDEEMNKFMKLSIEEMVETRPDLSIIRLVEGEVSMGVYLSMRKSEDAPYSWGK